MIRKGTTTVMPTLALSDAALTLLHDIRLRGMVETADGDALDALVRSGYATLRGRAAVLTVEGRQAHATWARLPEGSDEAHIALAAYDQFLVLDRAVKELTTAWQLAAARANPDGFSIEEWELIDRLTALNDKIGAVIRPLGQAVARFGGYRPRFSNALRRLEEGERQWFSGLTCDSYHTVWWHLHEDLLLALFAVGRSQPIGVLVSALSTAGSNKERSLTDKLRPASHVGVPAKEDGWPAEAEWRYRAMPERPGNG